MLAAGACAWPKPPKAKPKAGTDELRRVLTYLSSALANGNPTDALSVFSKSYPGYTQLADRFAALTASFDIANEVEVTDETQQASDATLVCNWTLTLSDRTTGESRRKSRDVHVKFRRDPNGKWKIVDFDGADLFLP
jgi:ketosteroid isomerase-like protein